MTRPCGRGRLSEKGEATEAPADSGILHEACHAWAAARHVWAAWHEHNHAHDDTYALHNTRTPMFMRADVCSVPFP